MNLYLEKKVRKNNRWNVGIKDRQLFLRRKNRTRQNIKSCINSNPRLSVFRSSKNIYAQIIDDGKGITIVSASSLESSQNFSGSNTEGASKIGALIADRALKKGVKSVVFDRGGYKYHGRVKALAEAARSAGLKF